MSETKILVACSGGPDSMALLDMLVKQGKCCYVAHVNYHRRPTADRDMLIVNAYCVQKGLPLFIKNVFFHGRGNFQAWARDERYAFFAKLVRKYDLKGVYVAHQNDDLLETYLMQKEKGLTPDHYGLEEHVKLHDTDLYRPLLKYSKAELLQYLKDNRIPYGHDESNDHDTYRRNYLRHHILNDLKEEQLSSLNQAVLNDNEILQKQREKARVYLNDQPCLSVERFEAYEDQKELLRLFLGHKLAGKYLQDLLKSLKGEGNRKIPIGDRLLIKEYGMIYVMEKPVPYCDLYPTLTFGQNEHYRIHHEGDRKHAVTVKAEDFPLTIRSFKAGDTIRMRYGHKKVSRFFIDHKIPYIKRVYWPIVCNAQGAVILVPGMGCAVDYYSINANLFVIEL